MARSSRSESGCQLSGPASPPAPAIARRGRKFAHPSACPGTCVSGRSQWRRSTLVPPSIAVRRNSTREAPGASTSLPANPQETTTRCGRSTRRYSPRTGCPAILTLNLPPGTGSRSACWPIQAVMPPSVVRYSKTASGGAPISMESRNSATADHLPRCDSRSGSGSGFRRSRLHRGLEIGQPARPEVIEVGAHRRQAIGPDGEQVARALPALHREPGPAQHPEMVGGRLLRQAERLGDRSRRPGPSLPGPCASWLLGAPCEPTAVKRTARGAGRVRLTSVV